MNGYHFEIFGDDPIQAAELDAFAAHCTPGMRLLDVGAHHGLFALAAIHFGRPGARIVCVEASPAAVTILRKNILINSAVEQVCVVNAAIGGENGEIRMLTTGPFGGDYFVPAVSARRDAVRVAAKTMSTLLRECSFCPTHIKIDVEGSEFDVIHEARPTLRELRPVLFLELHGGMIASRGCDPERVLSDLRDCGYNRFLVGERQVDEPTLQAAQFNCRIVCLLRL